MASKHYAYFLDLMGQLDQTADQIQESKQRRVEQQDPHLPEVIRKFELRRYRSRLSRGVARCIDYFMSLAYSEAEAPVYEPWMLDEMLSILSLDLQILLEDIQVFLDFEEKDYLKFWQEAMKHVELAHFVSPDWRQSIRTQKAAIHARSKKKSYWPC